MGNACCVCCENPCCNTWDNLKETRNENEQAAIPGELEAGQETKAKRASAELLKKMEQGHKYNAGLE